MFYIYLKSFVMFPTQGDEPINVTALLIYTLKSLCIIDTGNCVPGKRENNDGSHTRGRNFIIYSCLYL